MADQPLAPRSPVRSGVTEWRHVCERCGEPMEERKCKITCGNCGYSRDCSDP
jgi:ribosomal protein S27AE